MLSILAAASARFEVVGRHALTDDGVALFDVQGVKIKATLEGTSKASAVMFKANGKADKMSDNHFVVWVDGERVGTTQSFNTSSWAVGVEHAVAVPLFSGLRADVPHEVVIEKTSEAAWNIWTDISPNYVGFMRFEGDSGMRYGTPPKTPTRRIEFLGDSITAGESYRSPRGRRTRHMTAKSSGGLPR
eukprot:5408966-Prymnesium_polylepis.1